MNSVAEEMSDKKVLIGTFVRTPYVPRRILRQVQELFDPEKIFIFSIKNDDTNPRLITFNVYKDDMGEIFTKYKNLQKNTLRLHRRKDSNTFYTLNSLNKVVREQNNGEADNNFEVDWNQYKNCCLVLDKEGNIRALETKLAKIIDTSDTSLYEDDIKTDDNLSPSIF